MKRRGRAGADHVLAMLVPVAAHAQSVNIDLGARVSRATPDHPTHGTGHGTIAGASCWYGHRSPHHHRAVAIAQRARHPSTPQHVLIGWRCSSLTCHAAALDQAGLPAGADGVGKIGEMRAWPAIEPSIAS